MMPTEKNHIWLSVITPNIENKKEATKNEVKSLNNAFCASLFRSLNIKPKLADASIGVKIHSKTRF